jgi:hypothetical protein
MRYGANYAIQTVESIFYMWRTTGNIKWRERGYKIFQAIEKQTRTKYGYSTVSGIDAPRVSHRDYMPRCVTSKFLLFFDSSFDTNDTAAGFLPKLSNISTCYSMITALSPSTSGSSIRRLILYLCFSGRRKKRRSSNSEIDLDIVQAC